MMQIGSEAARRLFEASNLPPEWSLFAQVICVMICAELVPMFIARQAPLKVSLWGIPILYFLSLLLRPLLYPIQWLYRALNPLPNSDTEHPVAQPPYPHESVETLVIANGGQENSIFTRSLTCSIALSTTG